MRKIPFFPFYGCKNWDSQRLSNLPKVILLISNRVRIFTSIYVLIYYAIKLLQGDASLSVSCFLPPSFLLFFSSEKSNIRKLALCFS